MLKKKVRIRTYSSMYAMYVHYVSIPKYILVCIALQLFNLNVARPIGTEGGAGEVQTNGTGDDAEHGTEDAHNIARPIGTEGGAGEVQANGTGDDAEHGTEDAREIEQDNVNEKVKAIEGTVCT